MDQKSVFLVMIGLPKILENCPLRWSAHHSLNSNWGGSLKSESQIEIFWGKVHLEKSPLLPIVTGEFTLEHAHKVTRSLLGHIAEHERLDENILRKQFGYELL